jgi:hypothetical protein
VGCKTADTKIHLKYIAIEATIKSTGLKIKERPELMAFMVVTDEHMDMVGYVLWEPHRGDTLRIITAISVQRILLNFESLLKLVVVSYQNQQHFLVNIYLL